MSKERNAERDPDEMGCELTINGIIHGVGTPETVGQKGYKKFTILLDITKNAQYPEQLEVEFFGKDLPAWFSDLLHAEGQAWRFRGKASSREYKDKYYTRVSVFWGGAMSNQPEPKAKIPPPFDYAQGESPRIPAAPEQQSSYDEIPF